MMKRKQNEEALRERIELWLDLAKRCARKAGVIQMEYLGKLSGYRLKGVANLVTEVDLLCEKEIIALLKREAPGHKILSEERGGGSLNSEYIWVIDPLDGTTNYAHGYLKFCVSIALVSRGKPLLGVVYDPIGNEMFYGVGGKGAFLNGKQIGISKVSKLKDALLATGFSYDRGKEMKRDLRLYNRVHPYPQGIRRDGAAALDLCYVACGRLDGFWQYNLNSWDVSAGVLFVEEAGGKVSDLKGEPMPLAKKELWASNGRIHQEFLKIVSQGGKNE